MPVIGFLCSASRAEWAPYITAFRNGLNDAGFTEGRDVVIEYRWADNHLDRLPALVDELIGQRVAAIFAGGGDPPALAAKAKTTTIPIIFAHGTDPIKDGLVAVLIGPAVTSLVYRFSLLRSSPNAWSCCASSFQKLQQSRSFSIQAVAMPRLRSVKSVRRHKVSV